MILNQYFSMKGGRDMNMILMMVKMDGTEIELEAYKLPNDLWDAELEFWKMMKIGEVKASYPEARCFYFKDKRRRPLLQRTRSKS